MHDHSSPPFFLAQQVTEKLLDRGELLAFYADGKPTVYKTLIEKKLSCSWHL